MTEKLDETYKCIGELQNKKNSYDIMFDFLVETNPTFAEMSGIGQYFEIWNSVWYIVGSDILVL